ncbi:hypothetical protein GS429_14285 [Natronorubrum sp. JWXQ-INN-674]|uniref:Uncharacterized protein n=1 Tax=Natronorubrum halalkaliphilum TaxID=2691917 RepID=A0A6B0VNY0_9EURY|nr:hypothetical protein [Natronorubrum halalkaliphilum]MXV63214.1 hypothetical protein [Natronorubrum halalkaliphilum]
MTIAHSLEPIRRPEYTGENRCVPCTVLNVLLAAVVSAAIGLVSPSLMAGSFVAFLGAIYLRGYLVPGTPELTKRYLSERVLALFGKSVIDDPIAALHGDEIDAEALLLEVGTVIDCPDGDDLCLEPGFHDAWIDRIRRETAADDVVRAFDVTAAGGELTLEDREHSFVVEAGGIPIGWWESRTAFVADVAAGRELKRRYPGWNDLENAERTRVLGSLRVFLEHCPTCDGTLELGTETVSSCCSSYDVVALACTDCDARLFEFDAGALEA